jgi:hypothetical protein
MWMAIEDRRRTMRRPSSVCHSRVSDERLAHIQIKSGLNLLTQLDDLPNLFKQQKFRIIVTFNDET